MDAAGVEEATAINDSLFELGKAISDLSQDPPPQFVNMRNSKLTLIMSDSLGGNAKTLMVVCVSPATFNVPETINSLEFATRCKRITNAAVKNADEKKVAVARLRHEHRQEVQRLEDQVRALEAEVDRATRGDPDKARAPGAAAPPRQGGPAPMIDQTA